jgi:hypothetical protein
MAILFSEPLMLLISYLEIFGWHLSKFSPVFSCLFLVSFYLFQMQNASARMIACSAKTIARNYSFSSKLFSDKKLFSKVNKAAAVLSPKQERELSLKLQEAEKRNHRRIGTAQVLDATLY